MYFLRLTLLFMFVYQIKSAAITYQKENVSTEEFNENELNALIQYIVNLDQKQLKNLIDSYDKNGSDLEQLFSHENSKRSSVFDHTDMYSKSDGVDETNLDNLISYLMKMDPLSLKKLINSIGSEEK